MKYTQSMRTHISLYWCPLISSICRWDFSSMKAASCESFCFVESTALCSCVCMPACARATYVYKKCYKAQWCSREVLQRSLIYSQGPGIFFLVQVSDCCRLMMQQYCTVSAPGKVPHLCLSSVSILAAHALLIFSPYEGEAAPALIALNCRTIEWLS